MHRLSTTFWLLYTGYTQVIHKPILISLDSFHLKQRVFLFTQLDQYGYDLMGGFENLVSRETIIFTLNKQYVYVSRETIRRLTTL